MNTSYILALSDPMASLETVGGKALSLAKMSHEGFPVPDGFTITVAAYRAFIDKNDLQAKIISNLETVEASQPASLEAVSLAIRELFAQGKMPVEVDEAVREAYKMLPHLHPLSKEEKGISVAVRSSATAEDLPESSFAGQQETYLNIHGIEGVLEAVRQCWASLWTGRAIAYRLKNKIDQDNVALAVVVQQMVKAEASGVLFTANPINGRRDEIVINASWGLGEAIVGGLVTPDTIVVEKATLKVKKMEIAEKTVITVATDSGTETKSLTGARRRAKVLKGPQISELAAFARKIEKFYGTSQDIEWCKSNGQFYIVQSRPITALAKLEPPAKAEWRLPRGAYAAMRNNIVELMVSPLSPLFATLGISAVNTSLQRLMSESFGMRGIMPPDIIVVVNDYAYFNGSISLKSMGRMIFGVRKILKMMFSGAVERWTKTGRPHYYQVVESWQGKSWRSFASVELVEGARQLTEAAIDAYGALISGVIPAAWITEALFTKLYNQLIKRRNDPVAPTYLLGYDSLPIQADKSLYNLAEWARKSQYLVSYMESAAASQIEVYMGENTCSPEAVPPMLWKEFCLRFDEHLKKFGHTLYELDFALPVPADEPGPVLEAFKLYLSGQGVNPNTRQLASATRREQAVEAVRQRLKGLRLKWFNQTLAAAQKYAPLREDGLADIGLAYPLVRQMLSELGQRCAEHEIIPTAEDIYWLTEAEVLQNAWRLDTGQPVKSLLDVIIQRKDEHRAALRATPPTALPQMKIFGFDLMSLKNKRGRGSKGNIIKGVAASPGQATGTARVLHGSEDFSRMNPGDVLVASITTPAWTPLFSMASAVVTDVGGPLSHGSIVAREYGIPAVLGTGSATRRIRDGQTITVDGSAGTIILE